MAKSTPEALGWQDEPIGKSMNVEVKQVGEGHITQDPTPQSHDFAASSSLKIAPGQPLARSHEHQHHHTPGFLSAPIAAPMRPMSPDALSNLSLEEYSQLGRTLSQNTRRGVIGSTETEALEGDPELGELDANITSRRGFRAQLHASWIHNKGVLTMLLAQLFGTLMNVTTRVLEVEGNHGAGLHPFHILFARMVITVICATGYMWYQQTPHFPWGAREVRYLLMARGFGGFFGVFGMYYSLLYLPLADATVITFLAPSLACWACSILIKEPFTRIEQIGGLVSLVGVVLIAQPASLFPGSNASGETPPAAGTGDVAASNGTMASPGPAVAIGADLDAVTPTQRLTAVAIALLGVLGTAAAFTTIRWIGRRAHPLLNVNYFSIWCMIVSFVMMLVLPDVGFHIPANARDWGLLLFLGCCGFVMQFLLAYGLAYEKSSRATNIVYMQMLFALGFDKLIFGHSPTLLSIVGSSLILGPAIVVALQKSTKSDAGKEQANAMVQVSETQPTTDEESRVGLMADVALHDDHAQRHSMEQGIELTSIDERET